MNKKSCKILFFILAFPLISILAQEETHAYAKIITPITIIKTSDLHFGTMSVSSTPGSCKIDVAGNRTKTGGVSLTSFNPTATNAAYDVTGSNGFGYNISLPTSSITVMRNGGTETMTISSFETNKTSNASTLSLSGTDSFKVGATLSVEANQVAGLYEGTFTVTVAYQ